MATLHACLDEGVDAHQAVSAIKKRLASEHGISHATVEPEFGQCADRATTTITIMSMSMMRLRITATITRPD